MAFTRAIDVGWHWKTLHWLSTEGQSTTIKLISMPVMNSILLQFNYWFIFQDRLVVSFEIPLGETKETLYYGSRSCFGPYKSNVCEMIFNSFVGNQLWATFYYN